MRRTLAVILSVAALAAPALAQNDGQITGSQASGYTLVQTSRLVVLDVVVKDAAGHVVPGLKKQDFTVTEDGQPQKILNFTASNGEMLPANLAIHSTRQLDAVAPMAPVTILLLDEFDTQFNDIAFARYSLKKYLDQEPDRLRTPTMLIAVSMDHFTVLQDYTTDKQQLEKSLQHALAVYPWQAEQGAWLPERFATAFATLMRVAEASEGHPGHKNMIWIGSGFPSIDYRNGEDDAIERVNSVVQQCVDMLRDARVTLYSIDPAGVMTAPGSYGQAAALDDPLGGNYQFSALATATGGEALFGRNNVDAEIGDAVQDGEQFYTLTYKPSGGSGNPKKFRRIHVTLAEPGLTATTREGYYIAPTPEQVHQNKPPLQMRFDLISAADSSLVYDAVPVHAAPVPGQENTFQVAIPPNAVVWTPAENGQPRQTQFVLMVDAFDRKGNEVYRDAMLVHPSEPAANSQDRMLAMTYTIPPTKDAVRARFVVRLNANGRMGTADVPLTPVTAAKQ